eukprot:6213645-Pleurochrysis_carterae.AAC.2
MAALLWSLSGSIQTRSSTDRESLLTLRRVACPQVDVDKSREMASMHNVKSMPTMQCVLKRPLAWANWLTSLVHQGASASNSRQSYAHTSSVDVAVASGSTATASRLTSL